MNRWVLSELIFYFLHLFLKGGWGSWHSSCPSVPVFFSWVYFCPWLLSGNVFLDMRKVYFSSPDLFILTFKRKGSLVVSFCFFYLLIVQKVSPLMLVIEASVCMTTGPNFTSIWAASCTWNLKVADSTALWNTASEWCPSLRLYSVLISFFLFEEYMADLSKMAFFFWILYSWALPMRAKLFSRPVSS